MKGRVGEIRRKVESGGLDEELRLLYGAGEVPAQRERRLGLIEAMEKRFAPGPVLMAASPGRTELGGNHTDHNRGRVLTAAIQLDCLAAASATDDLKVTVQSEGFPGEFLVDLDDLTPRENEFETTEALIRGTAAGLAERGFKIGGFNACLAGNIPVGAGLSSSAAVEILFGNIFNQLYNAGSIPALTLAQAGHTAETRYFGKPSGLMDQIASAFSGLLKIDFKDPESPVIERIDFDLTGSGYSLLVVNTGSSHADLTGDYAAIAVEMTAAARQLGREAARGLTRDDLLEAVPRLRPETGDRAILRLLHFIEEDQRVEEQAAALKQGRMTDFLQMTADSGDSSWRLLQNCVSPSSARDQGIPLALALTERFLHGQGACRIHGGGFAGTILVYVPAARFEDYRLFMDRVFGHGAVIPLRIRRPGGMPA